ncbi:MAG: LptE family protein [candidate division Zixibacteria bacterium]|nr:LptE family protein [candidate division Zixibacteria bacterium]
MKKCLLIFIVADLLFVILGCGIYSFSPGGKSSIKTIAISQFENKTIESGLTSRMTDLIVDAFISDGNLKVASLDKADAILTGDLTNYERKAKSFTESDTVNLYTVNLTFDFTLTDRKTEKPIWKETFYSDGVYSPTTETEEDGQSRAVSKLVIGIINKTTKSW